MDVRTLKDLYLKELVEARSMEEQISNFLPKMVEAVHDETLRGALEDHLVETRSQIDRINSILQSHDMDVDGHSDQSMQHMIEEADSWVRTIDDPEIRDAALIASVQRVEHYEIAVYGSLRTWAKQLGLPDEVETLQEILEEEKVADEQLTRAATRDVNPHAAM